MTAWIDRGMDGLFIKNPIRRGRLSENRRFTDEKSGFARSALSGVLNSTPVTKLRGIPIMRSAIRREARFAAGMYVGVGCFVPVERSILLLRH